ncbi:MAG: DUF4367 domain-containing protein [Clostridia bacterium]|nr:DUF4367 domain-containing protein [Clostridia bacterium]
MNDTAKSRLVYALLEAEGAELVNTECTFVPSNAFSQRIRRLAERPERYTKKSRVKKIVIILIAAAILLTGCTAIKPVRTAIANFIITIFEKGSFIDKSEDKKANDRITEFYSPKFIPEGYELVEEKTDKTKADRIILRVLEFKCGDNELSLYQLTSKSTMTLDTENSEIKTFRVNEIECMSSKNDDGYHIIWDQYGYRFLLSMSADFTEETAIKIIESVEKIEFTNN